VNAAFALRSVALSSFAGPSPLVLMLALAGCAEEFEPGSNVSSLRVLAIQADNPFAAPGETVRLQATSHDPAGREITWAWLECSNPASSSVDGCLADIGQAALDSGVLPLLATGRGLDAVELAISPSALDELPVEARPNALTGVLAIACPGDLDLDLSSSTAERWPFRCTDASGAELGLHDSVAGVKRVFIRSSDRNQNPTIGSVTFDGELWAADDVKEVDACATDDFAFDDCEGKGDHRIAAVLDAPSFEAGSDEFGREFTEQLIVQHYATDAIFDDEVRVGEQPETRFVARQSASGQELRVWFVARDDRGGVSTAERRVRVR
jgi:hypothetical protein